MPRVQDLERRYEKQGLVVVMLHSATGAEGLQKYLKEKKIRHPVAIEGKAGKNEARYRSSGYPTFTFIGRNGKIRYADVDTTSLDAAAKALVNERAAR